MKHRKASGTAIYPAVLRAAHQIVDDNPKIFTDPVAVSLVDWTGGLELRARFFEFQQPFSRLIRSVCVLRNRFAEDELETAVSEGVQQYIILGAGLDTFAYRQPLWAANIRIIEVDHPASQQFKRTHLARVGITKPANVEYCPIDFERTTLTEGLASASLFDIHAPAFFSWLGVNQYLTHSAIEATSRFVLSLSVLSRIAFTFVLQDTCLDGEDLWIARMLASSTISSGEPWLSRFDPQALQQWLFELGFSNVFYLSPTRASGRYFGRRTDGLRAPIYEQLMCALV